VRRLTALLTALLGSVILAAWGVAGCGHPLLPSSHPVIRGTTASLGKSDWPVLGLDEPVLGVDLYALSNYPAAQVETYGKRMLAYIKNVLKADAVGIVWNFYAPSISSDAVRKTNATLSPQNVEILTRLALQDHLLVQYRPLILMPSEPSPWEGQITPYLQPTWFDNYFRAELPYLKVAQRFGIREFVTGTELVELNSSPLWSPLFARVSRVYHGLISYSAWDGNYFGASPEAQLKTANPQLPPVKYVGMDMYWHTNIPPDATQSKVTAAWESLFRKVPASLLRRTAIDEMGIQARAGAYANPQDLGRAGRLSETVQSNWFTAACHTVRRYHMRGVFFFKVDLTDNPEHPATSLSTFEGRQGASAIAACARILK
jgi:hypothetical protein